VNVAFFSDVQYPDPEAASCKWCHEVLISADDGSNNMCQRCGVKVPIVPVTSQSQNQNQKSESKSKLKQRDSLENKSFIISPDVQRDRKRKSEIEGPEDLSALNYVSGRLLI
jgi:DNA-directed RNA polymerase subunit M/transcription elongation factor TFIIS